MAQLLNPAMRRRERPIWYGGRHRMPRLAAADSLPPVPSLRRRSRVSPSVRPSRVLPRPAQARLPAGEEAPRSTRVAQGWVAAARYEGIGPCRLTPARPRERWSFGWSRHWPVPPWQRRRASGAGYASESRGQSGPPTPGRLHLGLAAWGAPAQPPTLTRWHRQRPPGRWWTTRSGAVGASAGRSSQ